MHPIVIGGLVSCFVNLLIGFYVLIKAPRRRLNRLFFLFNICIGFWSVGSFLLNITSPTFSIWVLRGSYVFSILIVPAFFGFVESTLNIRINKIIKSSIYAATAIFLFFLPTNLFIQGILELKDGTLLSSPGIVYYFYILYFISTCSYGLLILFLSLKVLDGIRLLQLKYIVIAYSIAFLAGFDYFLTVLGALKTFPIDDYILLLPFFILCYSIVKYQYLDIKVVFTRAGIFLLVYSLVLGIPVWIGFKLLGNGIWLYPMIIMGVFATNGPFIYLYFQKRAEDALLQEQRRYQMTLRQASAGMGRIKDLKKLLSLIVHIVTRAVRLEHALIYVHDSLKQQFSLGSYKRRKIYTNFVKSFPDHSPLSDHLIQISAPIIYEEIKLKSQDINNKHLIEVVKIIENLDGELIVPILIEKRLLAIVVLGRKESGKVYSEDDISVFSILANQTALAIENAQFYEEMKKTHEQLFQAEKMATIGTMADGLSHQINNRFHALGFIAGDALDTIKMSKNQPIPDGFKEIMSDLERAFVRVQENVIQGGEVVQGLLKYTRKGDTGFTAVDFDQVFKAALEMAQFKIKTQELRIEKKYDDKIPKIKGNFTQLQEVFFNLIDNGYDAMMQRKSEKQEAGFQPTLCITVKQEDNFLEAVFADNGIGVKDEDVHKLFTPFFTTKLSSKKGTGLGLYVIKKIIEENHSGTVEMASQYMAGTQMKLRLPIAVE